MQEKKIMKKQYMNPSLEVIKLDMEKAVLNAVSGETNNGYADSSELDVDDDW